jgi:tetratricopeptide (TPR) repeat protein
MKMRAFLLTVLLSAVVLASAPAQDLKPPLSGKTQAPALDQRAEDIEIMRRLLQRTLERQQHEATNVSNGVPSANGRLLWHGKHLITTMNQNRANPNAHPVWDMGQPNVNLWNSNANNPLWLNSITAPSYPVAFWDASTGTVQNTATGQAAPLQAALPEMRGLEGVYLKGYGVVYTATLGVPTVPLVIEANKPAPKPLTEWERTRRELRGETTETTKKGPQDSLADAVLKMLAKNGQHLSQLGENEQITVVLTLSRASSIGSCMACHGPSSGSTSSSSSSSGTGTSSSSSTSGPGASAEPNKSSAAEIKETEEKIKTAKSDFEKEVLLGDLHMKQGKNEQAAASFESALRWYGIIVNQQSQQPKGSPAKEPYRDSQLEKSFLETAAKLLQVYAALGKTDQVQTTLKALERHAQRVKAAETASKPTEAPIKEELPGKLVISASKKLLDFAGAGQITFEEFRKNATVEYQPARTIEKQPAKPASDQK